MEHARLKWGTGQQWLRLGRISNLPTVWTNVLGAGWLSVNPARPSDLSTWGFGLGLLGFSSVFYVAGMILNDAFDAAYDARFRATRPIPRGDISKTVAFLVGFGLLGLASLGVAALGALRGQFLGALTTALGRAAAIVVYDAHHKNNPLSPVLMGLCRGMTYVMVASTLGGLNLALLVAATLQVLYVIGLTHTAKQEDLAKPGSWWPLVLLFAPAVYAASILCAELPEHSLLVAVTLGGYLAWLWFATRPLLQKPRTIGEAVGRLIAGISLLDAVLISLTGSVTVTLLAIAAVVSTRALHRFVPGT